MDVKAIFEKALEIRARTTSASDKMAEFFKILSPTNYAPFFEHDEMSGFLDGIKLMNPELAKDFSWFFYEADIDGTKIWEYTLSKADGGKTFKVKNEKTFLALLKHKYGNK